MLHSPDIAQANGKLRTIPSGVELCLIVLAMMSPGNTVNGKRYTVTIEEIEKPKYVP